jgi:hypothetical protein
MEKINLYRRAVENNGIVILSDVELLMLLENSKPSTRNPEATIIKEDVWSSSQGNWGGENGIATYIEKKPFTLENLEVYKVWQETFNGDGYARENDEERMRGDVDCFNEVVKAIAIQPASADYWIEFHERVEKRLRGANHEELMRVALFLKVD